MAGTIKNGSVWKWIAGALFTLLLASAVWIWNAAGEAAMVVSDVAAVKEAVTELKPVAAGNRESIIGIGKDVERLNEKVGDLETSQKQMITEQRAAFGKVMERLPKNNTPGG